MRARSAAILLVTAMSACSRAPVPATPAPLAFSVQPFGPGGAPPPLLEVTAGHVRAVVPGAWDARPLSSGFYSQEGFVASPRLDRFERGAGSVQGIEAFWVDLAALQIPSDYYYLAARNEAISALGGNKACHPDAQHVLADHPPDLTGRRFSPSDYVAVGSGTCLGRPATRWTYLVAAPGFGPLREVGIPTSGLYVVIAVVSGPNADRLLKEMLREARFGDTTVSQLVKAAQVQ